MTNLLCLAFLILATLSWPVIAEVVVIKMLDGQQIFASQPFPTPSHDGKTFFLIAIPFDTHMRPVQAFAVRDIVAIERARFVEGHKLGDPCAFEWKLTFRGKREQVKINLPVLAELPESAATFSRTQLNDLFQRGKQNKDALAYGGRFIRSRCAHDPNLVAEGLPLLVIDRTSGSPKPRQLNITRLASLELLPDDQLEDALSRVQLPKPQAVSTAPEGRIVPPASTRDFVPPPVAHAEQPPSEPRDNMGRKVLNGPLGPGFYTNVRIVSSTIGIDAGSDLSIVTVIDSVIEASVCIRSAGYRTVLRGNELRCGLCVEFVGSSLIGNELTNNICTGRGTNRPDVFGW
jgi:hypothetical protein